jgi:type I restriction enzyme R subunit
VAAKKLTDFHTGAPVAPAQVSDRNAPSTLESRLFEPERIKTMCAHYFARLLATGENDPLQKSIIFCASDAHADLVANELNNLYAKWCRANDQRRVATYAFKCMSSVNGQSLIPSFRGRKRSHIVATTKDLLTTGVNLPCRSTPARGRGQSAILADACERRIESVDPRRTPDQSFR